MTFGVDQCRRCGIEIKPSRPGQLQEYLDALKKTPTMPESEWRKRGFLAMPTRPQIFAPQEGCCQPCAEKLIRTRMGAFRRMRGVAIAGVLALVAIWQLSRYITH